MSTKEILENVLNKKPLEIAKVFNSIMEEKVADVLNELSKKTLGNYIKKAAEHASGHEGAAGYFMGKRDPDPDRNQADLNKAWGHLKISDKRKAGISKATDKLTKEDKDSE